jgi:hypothetical protein
VIAFRPDEDVAGSARGIVSGRRFGHGEIAYTQKTVTKPLNGRSPARAVLSRVHVRFRNEAGERGGRTDHESSMAGRKLTRTSDQNDELPETSTVDACRRQLEGLERRFGDIDEVGGFPRGRFIDKAQEGPTDGIEQLLCSSDCIFRTIVCKQMQPSTVLIDRGQVFGSRHREKTCGGLRRPKDTVHEEETVTLSGLHEEIFLRRSRGLDQCSERLAKPMQLLRIVLIYAGYITAELRSAVSLWSTGVLAQPNIGILKCPIDLSKNNRRRRVFEFLKRSSTEDFSHAVFFDAKGERVLLEFSDVNLV